MKAKEEESRLDTLKGLHLMQVPYKLTPPQDMSSPRANPLSFTTPRPVARPNLSTADIGIERSYSGRKYLTLEGNTEPG